MNSSPQRTVGLALGGGVVRGMAHIGVLEVLEEAGIAIGLIAGSSAGSLIGASYCAGMGVAGLKDIARKMNWLNLIRPVWPSKGFFSFRAMEAWLVRQYGELYFSDLKIPLGVVTTDLLTGAMIVLNEGRVFQAVKASCSVAGVIEPTELNGHLLCDGNFSNSVPSSVVRSMGADIVIGVDIFTPSIRRHFGAIGYMIAGFEVLIQSSGGGLDEADCLISPDLAGETYLRFSQYERLIALGAQAAREKLPEIIKMVEAVPVV